MPSFTPNEIRRKLLFQIFIAGFNMPSSIGCVLKEFKFFYVSLIQSQAKKLKILAEFFHEIFTQKPQFACLKHSITS